MATLAYNAISSFCSMLINRSYFMLNQCLENIGDGCCMNVFLVAIAICYIKKIIC
jgi:hypothetical protein